MKNSIQKSNKNIHIALAPELYQVLSSEAKSLHQSISKTAQLALIEWLEQKQRSFIDKKIDEYIEQCAGKTDLDRDFEKASIASILEE